jgi:uncharacterized protein (DUF2235 family)
VYTSTRLSKRTLRWLRATGSRRNKLSSVHRHTLASPFTSFRDIFSTLPPYKLSLRRFNVYRYEEVRGIPRVILGTLGDMG